MTNQAGKPRKGGRSKGTPNKISGDARQWIADATALAGSWVRDSLSDRLKAEGLSIPSGTSDQVVYLAKQAIDHPQTFISSCVGKIVPREVTVEAGRTLEDILTDSWERRQGDDDGEL